MGRLGSMSDAEQTSQSVIFGLQVSRLAENGAKWHSRHCLMPWELPSVPTSKISVKSSPPPHLPGDALI